MSIAKVSIATRLTDEDVQIIEESALALYKAVSPAQRHLPFLSIAATVALVARLREAQERG